MKSIRNVDVLYTIHEKSRVLEECICRVESACDTGHFESVDSALRRVSAFWPDLCDACRTLYRLSGEQLDIYVRLTQPAYAADLHLVEPDTLPPS